jgi:hypothetical protein
MSWSLMNDDAIIQDLASRLDHSRRAQHLKDSELSAKGGFSDITMGQFRSGKNITLKTFIRILRALGELERLENVFSAADSWRPMGTRNDIPEKRVRGKKTTKKPFVWGDES